MRATKLKTNIHVRPPGVVPAIEIEPTDHPLAVEQRDGITLDRIVALARDYLDHRG